ncbi:MAG: hypothetical protein JEY96_16850 [Bacteroidales bacterium]|nr:hypothetical protein [Bacteroidales bacterium]
MKTTLEVLTEDLQSMQKEREEAIVTVQMYNGAVQYLETKIQELTPKAPKGDITKPDKK